MTGACWAATERAAESAWRGEGPARGERGTVIVPRWHDETTTEVGR